MTRRARRRQRGSGLPDWAWGVGLGALAVIIVGSFFLITQVTGGGGGGTCDQPLPPLNVSDISQDSFNDQYDVLGEVVGFLNAGDKNAAQTAFTGPTHNFTHNIDPVVRQQDPDLAKQLCEVVIEIENGLFDGGSTGSLALQMAELQQLVADSAVALNYERPQ